ncbi:hypothetical protein [Sulfurimonas sp.]
MILTVILSVAILLTIAFHFVGVYANATKFVWIALILLWAAGISIFTSEIKPKGYDGIKQMQGKYTDTDKLIQASMPEVSVYELILIKQSYLQHEPQE